MDDKEWKETFAPLSEVKLPDQAKAKIRRVLENGVESGAANLTRKKEATRARATFAPRLRNVFWWTGTAVVAAALIGFIVVAGPWKSLNPPIDPAARGVGRNVASSEPVTDIQMVDAQVGWAASLNGDVLRTTDGGATWLDVTPVDLPKAEPVTTPTVPFFLDGDPQAAWLLDTRTETVYRTVDGGQHWQAGAPPKLDIVNDGGVSLAFASKEKGWLLVSSGTNEETGQLFRTGDGGLTWTSVSKTGTGNTLPAGGRLVFSRAVDGLGWLKPDPQVGSQGMAPLYVTTDGGRNWTPQHLALPATYRSYSSDQLYFQLPQFASDNAQKDPKGAPSGLEGVLPVTLGGGKHNGALIYTTGDGGATWTLAGSIDNAGSGTRQITSMIDSQTFLVYVPDGNTLWVTRDGGKNWAQVQPQPSLYDSQPSSGRPVMTRIDFVSADQGWAVVNGSVFSTTDGGRTWSGKDQTGVVGTLKVAPQELTMFDGQHGYGSADGHPVMITNDGGHTWTDVTPEGLTADSGVIVKGYFIDVKTGWVFSLRASQDVTVYGTTDGGQSWSKLATAPVKYGDGNMSIAFSDAQHGWFEDLSAGMGQLPGELLATSDGGQTWQRVAQFGSVLETPGTLGVWPSGVLPFGGSLTAQSDGTLWLSGAQRATGGGPGYLYFFKSTDGGKTWSRVSLPAPTGHERDTTDVSAPTFVGKSGFVSVLYNGQAGVTSILFASSDLGQTWSARGELALGKSLITGFAPVFVNPQIGWLTGGQHLYRTGDGGKSWQEVNPDATLRQALQGRTVSLVSINPSGSLDDQHYLVILESSMNSNVGPLLLTTDDGGQNWSVTAGGA